MVSKFVLVDAVLMDITILAALKIKCFLFN